MAALTFRKHLSTLFPSGHHLNDDYCQLLVGHYRVLARNLCRALVHVSARLPDPSSVTRSKSWVTFLLGWQSQASAPRLSNVVRHSQRLVALCNVLLTQTQVRPHAPSALQQRSCARFSVFLCQLLPRPHRGADRAGKGRGPACCTGNGAASHACDVVDVCTTCTRHVAGNPHHPAPPHLPTGLFSSWCLGTAPAPITRCDAARCCARCGTLPACCELSGLQKRSKRRLPFWHLESVEGKSLCLCLCVLLQCMCMEHAYHVLAHGSKLRLAKFGWTALAGRLAVA